MVRMHVAPYSGASGRYVDIALNCRSLPVVLPEGAPLSLPNDRNLQCFYSRAPPAMCSTYLLHALLTHPLGLTVAAFEELAVLGASDSRGERGVEDNGGHLKANREMNSNQGGG